MSSRVQGTGTFADLATSIALAFVSNVASGNLAIFSLHGYSAIDDAPVADDATKSAGTSTVGTITLDRPQTLGGADFAVTAIFSVPITGAGSCTLQVAGRPADSYLDLSILEATGVDVTASRVETTNGNTGTGSAAPVSGNVTSVGSGFAYGAMTSKDIDANTITPEAAWSQNFEMEDGTLHTRASAIYRTFPASTTDQAEWAIGGGDDYSAAVVLYKDAGAAPASLVLDDRKRRFQPLIVR